jgi:hypothetical protein
VRLWHSTTIVDPGARMRRGRPVADPEAGGRIKTDRRDAASLAKLHRAGEPTAVWLPDARQVGYPLFSLIWCGTTQFR